MPLKKTVAPQEISVAPDSLLLVGIPEAARRMSTTVFAVRELCRSGKLKFVPIGHKWLISPRAIQEFIDKSQRYYEEVAAKEAV
jgi:excisionase family DNA binding protein